ncbi:MAG: LruC domain-containing protein [Chlorobi bacterium]|nr:LruC domain-containing protein [Chlorobiota bacterium]
MKTKLLILMMAGLITTFMVSCKKSTTPTPSDPTFKDMQVPDGFTFKTTREVSLGIKMPQSLDFSGMRSRFDVYTAKPTEGGSLITSGSFDTNGEFSGIIRIPTALTEVYVKSIAGSALVEVQSVSFKEDGVIIDFGDDYGYNIPDTTDPGGKSAPASLTQFEGRDLASVESNSVGNGDFETNSFGTMLYWSSLHPVDSKWYFTQYSGSMEWYNDGGNGLVRTPWTEGGSQYYYGGVAQMIDAEPGDVISFSADIKSVGNNNRLYSWLYIIPVNSSNHALAYYNVRYYRPSATWTNKQVAATMPSGTDKVKILVWTNDYAAEASVYIDNIVVTGTVVDSDNDGVDDELDDYPNDASRAFDVYYPNEDDWGTLVYEDLWPGTGDYDFNDLVLDYQFKSVLSSSNKLVEFFVENSVRAVGASLHNGFAFSLGGDPSNIASVTGSSMLHGDVDLNANGTEQGQTNTVIFLFDDSFDMIGSSGSTFINTQPGIPYVDPDTNTVHVLYQNPVSVSTTGTAPYNPFIVADLAKSRGTEVHLPGQQATDLADTGLFGQWADDTDPASGKYYQTATNLPWALDIPESFDYPVEQVEVISAYNHFREWAESGGANYADWYKDLSGYRNSGNIYVPDN